MSRNFSSVAGVSSSAATIPVNVGVNNHSLPENVGVYHQSLVVNVGVNNRSLPVNADVNDRSLPKHSLDDLPHSLISLPRGFHLTSNLSNARQSYGSSGSSANQALSYSAHTTNQALSYSPYPATNMFSIISETPSPVRKHRVFEAMQGKTGPRSEKVSDQLWLFGIGAAGPNTVT